MADSDLDATIRSVAASPAEAAGDQGRVRGQSLKELIEADKYLRAKSAAQSTALPIRIVGTEGPSAIA